MQKNSYNNLKLKRAYQKLDFDTPSENLNNKIPMKN